MVAHEVDRSQPHFLLQIFLENNSPVASKRWRVSMDDDELSECFTAHAPALALYARQWLDRWRAEDAVQEAFVRLILQRVPPRNVKAWLYRTVRNEAISQWRSSRSREARERRSASPEACLESHDDAEAVIRAMALLPAIEREILVLRIWGELGLREISELVGIPPSTVFQHYKSALETMRKWMDATCQKKTH